MSRATHREEGFALIVITAMFVAFALLATTVIDRSNATKQLEMQKVTRDRLSRISYALIEYSLKHPGNPYPCPASMAEVYAPTPPATSTFGFSVADCDSLAPAGLTLLPHDVVIMGMVPVKTLGLPDTDAFDVWNNRIVYAVDRAMTVTTASTALAASPANRIAVTEYNIGETFASPDFLVMSYGKDGLGATPKSMTSVAISCPAGTDLRSHNCDNNNLDFIQGPLMIAPSATVTTYFDDILSFYGRTE